MVPSMQPSGCAVLNIAANVFFPGRLPCKRRLPRVFAASLVAACLTAQAGQGGSELAVTATVRAYTRVEVLSQPGGLEIAQADLDRGYVDVSVPVQLSITSNDPRGAILMLAATSDYVDRTDVTGLLDGSVVLGREGGVVAVPSGGPGRQQNAHTLRFRFFLTKSTPVGRHAWPIQVSTQIL